jgi:NAD(P)-dependent dehydrogenase (short-subunit alcohol dehydrogenase family)
VPAAGRTLLSGRVAIVTGGGGRIGRAISRRFAAEGASVAVADVKLDPAAAVVEEIGRDGGIAHPFRMDITRPDQVERVLGEVSARWGTPGILINNAGLVGLEGLGDTSFLGTDLDLCWRPEIEINLTGTFICSQVVARAMAAASGGTIVNISSISGLVATNLCTAYGVAKAGVIMLTKQAAAELAPFGIRVNCIAPGPILDGAPSVHPEAPLLERTGRPEEIAAAALYLASDESSYTTGAILSVDGGAAVTFRGRRRAT